MHLFYSQDWDLKPKLNAFQFYDLADRMCGFFFQQTPAEQFFLAYQYLDRAISAMNQARLLTVLPDGASVLDHCCKKVRCLKWYLTSKRVLWIIKTKQIRKFPISLRTIPFLFFSMLFTHVVPTIQCLSTDSLLDMFQASFCTFISLEVFIFIDLSFSSPFPMWHFFSTGRCQRSSHVADLQYEGTILVQLDPGASKAAREFCQPTWPLDGSLLAVGNLLFSATCPPPMRGALLQAMGSSFLFLNCCRCSFQTLPLVRRSPKTDLIKDSHRGKLKCFYNNYLYMSVKQIWVY